MAPLPDLNNSNQTYPSEKTLGKRPASISIEPPTESPSGPSAEELERIRRLRADLEKSRLEAEQRHRDLERQIRELSNKTSDADSSGVNADLHNIFSVNEGARIVDDSKSKLLVLRRGKYDKTRRLLSASDSTVLHVSWLGVMQMVNKDSRCAFI